MRKKTTVVVTPRGMFQAILPETFDPRWDFLCRFPEGAKEQNGVDLAYGHGLDLPEEALVKLLKISSFQKRYAAFKKLTGLDAKWDHDESMDVDVEKTLPKVVSVGPYKVFSMISKIASSERTRDVNAMIVDSQWLNKNPKQSGHFSNLHVVDVDESWLRGLVEKESFEQRFSRFDCWVCRAFCQWGSGARACRRAAEGAPRGCSVCENKTRQEAKLSRLDEALARRADVSSHAGGTPGLCIAGD